MQAQLQANIHRPVPVVVIDVQGRFLKKFVTPQSWDPWAPGALLGFFMVMFARFFTLYYMFFRYFIFSAAKPRSRHRACL